LELAVEDESGPAWGHAANALINLVFEQHAVAVVTSPSGTLAHLSEQVGNRIGVPILTLSADSTTTQTDIPWIFRLGPNDDVQAGVIAQEIYRRRGFQRVVVVSERDHDGRLGSSAFEKAAQSLGAPKPASVQMNPLQPDYDSLLSLIKTKAPEAVVIWTRADIAGELLSQFRKEGIHTAVYLTQQASQDFSVADPSLAPPSRTEASGSLSAWTLASQPAASTARASFARRYQAATGRLPSATAAEAYDAVRLLASALRSAGPNRARVRDQIAGVQDVPGVSGLISFDSEGNDRSKVEVVRLR
jgi:branched-chain amino acid transport system substrate-binding protein